MPTLNADNFAELFGINVQELPEECLKKIKSNNWNYTIITGQERDTILIDLLTRIDNQKFSVVANEDKSRWVKGWGENLDALLKSDGDLKSLMPKYYKRDIPLRLNKEFIRAEDPN